MARGLIENLRQHQGQQRQRDDHHDEADHDLQRETYREYVELGRDPGHQGESDVGEEERDSDRPRDLEDHEKRLREERHEVGLEDRLERNEGQRQQRERTGQALEEIVVGIGRQVDQRAERELKFTQDADVLAGQRIDDVDDREADLEIHDLAGKLDPDEHQDGDEPEYEPDE